MRDDEYSALIEQAGREVLAEGDPMPSKANPEGHAFLAELCRERYKQTRRYSAAHDDDLFVAEWIDLLLDAFIDVRETLRIDHIGVGWDGDPLKHRLVVLSALAMAFHETIDRQERAYAEAIAAEAEQARGYDS